MRKLAVIILVALVAAGCGRSSRDAGQRAAEAERGESMRAPEKREYFDVAYARGSSRQKLDVLLPAEGEGPFPVILY